MRKYFDIMLTAALLMIAAIQPAHAYIDPGSGSVIMTALLGFFAAVGYTARKYFYKVKNLFTKKM